MSEPAMNGTSKQSNWSESEPCGASKRSVSSVGKPTERATDWYIWAGCHKVPEHASGARRKLARLVGREGEGKEQVAQGQYVVSDTRGPAMHDCEFV